MMTKDRIAQSNNWPELRYSEGEPKCSRCTSNRMIFVHGHYQCLVCKQIEIECCSGENDEIR